MGEAKRLLFGKTRQHFQLMICAIERERSLANLIKTYLLAVLIGLGCCDSASI